jgi:3-hexulose-6-phosphate synthase
MKLQLALDLVDLEGAKEILRQVGNAIDIVEIGTPFIMYEGIRAIKEIKKEFPYLIVLADLKIMDAGEHESRMAFEAGADIVTVLGVSDDSTIKGCVDEASRHNRCVMVDMIGVSDIEKRAIEIDSLNPDYICVHTAFDVQSTGKSPLHELKMVKRAIKYAGTAVAGGIKLGTIKGIADEKPDILIVGGGITNENDMLKTALAMKEIIKG